MTLAGATVRAVWKAQYSAQELSDAIDALSAQEAADLQELRTKTNALVAVLFVHSMNDAAALVKSVIADVLRLVPDNQDIGEI